MNRTSTNWIFLFSTNFLGIFNDNLLKNAIVFIAVAWVLPTWMTQAQLISIVSAALVIPYLLLSPLAGRWSVIYPKLKILRAFKLLELAIMLTASVAFLFQWIWLAILAVLMMGFQSCMYSPAKYGLIRDIGGPEGVSFGSGLFETMAFLAILIGTVVASYVSDHYHVWLLTGLFMLVALLGYLGSRSLKVTELPVETNTVKTTNPLKFLLYSFRFARQHRYINAGVLGASVFWLIGGMVQMNLVIHCVNTLGTSNTVTGLVMACAAVGIALGCTFAGLVSGKTVKTTLIPVGLIGMMISLVALILFHTSVLVCGLLVFVLAFMGGVFEIPCLSIVQKAEIGRELGNMIAYLNFVTFLFVLLGTGLFSVTTLLTHDNSLVVFGVILVICVLTLLFYLTRYPEMFRRFGFKKGNDAEQQ